MLKTFGLFLPYALSILILIVAYRYGDWRNWKKYYPTILFTISINLFSSVLTYDHWLWHFKKTFLIPNHTIADIVIKITNFPAIVLIYLTQYPFKSKLIRQFAYIAIWVVIWTLIEYCFVLTKMMTFHNGWHILFSFLLWWVLFLTLRIHHTRPLWAWFICLVYAVFVVSYFNIPITKMK